MKLCVQLLAAMLVTASSSAASDKDAAMSRRIVGTWTPIAGRETPTEEEGARQGIAGAERFLPGGKGKVILYHKVVCGDVIRVRDFDWKIVEGVLVATEPGAKPSRDRIVKLDRTELVLLSLDTNELQSRTRRGACGPG